MARYIQLTEPGGTVPIVVAISGLPSFVYAKENCKNCYGTGKTGITEGCSTCMGTGKKNDQVCPDCRGKKVTGNKIRVICNCVKHERELDDE
jgi:RecJ-like exonuclease